MKTRNLLLISAACLLSILSSRAQTIPSYIPTNGLVGWWPFNGNANDESGNGNNGTVNGATLTADRFGNAGKAYFFDGNNDVINTNLSSGFSNQYTIQTWVKTSSLKEAGIVSSRTSEIQYNGLYYSNTQKAEVWISSTTISNSIAAPPPINDNNWHHVLGVYSGTSGKIYLDGILENSSNTQFTISINNPFIFGYDNLPNQNRFFNGSIDDIAIWNRALSAQEISNLYQSSSPGGGGTAGSSKAFPQGISYQAIARNAQAQPLLNTALQLRFTLISDSVNGSSEYVETQALNSNAQGLINTSIGNGTAQSGSWAAINWSAGRKFLRAEMDAGSGFVNLGTQEMLSVPFSQRSKSADAIENSGLPVYGSNAEALAAGLKAGQMYRTAAGVLMVVY